MTDRSIGSVADETAAITEGSATDVEDPETTEDPADDGAQHASADVAPELFGW